MEREARVSLAAYRCLYPEAVELGGATVLRAEAAPSSPMLNRIVGLGVDEPATETVLDEALGAMGVDVSCYVALTPGARPVELADWLRERGLEPGWGWMSFRRGLDDVPEPAAALRLVRVGPAEARAFGHVVAIGYGLPEAVAPVGRGRLRGRLGLLARSRRRRARCSRGPVHRGGRRLSRLRRDAAGAPGQGWAGRAARTADPARPRAGCDVSSRKRASAATICRRARTATSSAPGSQRSP